MPKNHFYEKKGPFPLKEIIKTIGYNGSFSLQNNFEIHSFESLDNAGENDMTFLNSSKYKDLSLKTKAVVCITSSSLSKFLPEKCIKLDVKNILFAVTQASKMFFDTWDRAKHDILRNTSKLKSPFIAASTAQKLSEEFYQSTKKYRGGFTINMKYDIYMIYV